MKILSIIQLVIYVIIAAIALIHCCLGVSMSPISLLAASVTCVLLNLEALTRERKG